MRKGIFRRLAAAAVAAATVFGLAACGGADTGKNTGTNTGNGTANGTVNGSGGEEGYKVGDLSYYSYDSNDKEINKSLFYVNSNTEWGADPAIIYITDGEWAGYYYVYCTSGDIGTTGFCAWRSKNLTDWEDVGPVLLPNSETNWGYKAYWAPAIIYDKGKYYLFYSAPHGSSGDLRYDSCAVSDSPAGPFTEITGPSKTAKDPLLCFEKHTKEIPANLVTDKVGAYGLPGFIKAIGPNPFIDPKTGKRYLFFVADLGGEAGAETSGAYCLEMKDWATPIYSTLRRVTTFGKTKVEGGENILEGGKTNEGPMCRYINGKYYLIFLTYTYYNANYQTRLAVADSPMGPYTKFKIDDGAQVIYTESNFMRQAVGIHGLEYMGDSLMGCYMTFMNNQSYSDKAGKSSARKFAVDELIPVKNSQGQTVLQCNGPSVTPQPLPEALSGYKNVAIGAKVTADNAADGSSVASLTDRVIPYHSNSIGKEFNAKKGKTTVTLDLGDYKTLRAVMVYNSRDTKYMFDEIEKITFDYRKNGETGTVSIGPVRYNKDYAPKGKRAVGSAAIAEFADLDVKKVTIEIQSGDGKDGLAIPEIKLIGKDSDGSSAKAGEKKGALYEPYSFENAVYDYDFRTDCKSTLKIDGELDGEYGKVASRLFLSNNTKSPTYMDLYYHLGNDGVYVFAELHNFDMHYYEGKDFLENNHIDIGISLPTGNVNNNSLEFKLNIAGEGYRYRGVKGSGQWLKSWFKGLSCMKLKNGTIDNLDKSDGFTAEFFVPYSELGVAAGKVPDDVRVYFSYFLNEDDGKIKRTITTTGKGMNETEPSGWKKLKKQ